MRIEELRLAAVGPFTDRTLDLSGGDKGLHIVFGPNEAGKSSSLRAIRYLLFGFPTRLTDDFVHAYPKLRIGGRLTNDLGEELDITRRKAKQKSLRDADDAKEIDEDLLRSFLGYADENLFCRSFGIDHETLVQGGKEIGSGEGDLGQMLFSGSGIAHLRDVEMQLEEELAALFAARARKPEINAQLSGLKDARRRVRQHQLRPAEWERRYMALEDAQKQKERLESERNDNRRQRDRLARFDSALPRISEYLELQETTEQLQAVILLPAEFNTRREEILRNLSSAHATRSTASDEIENREKQLAQIEVSQELLDTGPRLISLEKNLHRFEDAQNDRPSVAAGLENCEAEVHSVLRDLGEEMRLEQAASLLLPAPERARIQRLVAKHGELVKAVDDANKTLAHFRMELRDRQQDLDDTPAPAESRSLQRAVSGALKLGNIDERVAELRQNIQHECEGAEQELRRLPACSGTLEQLESLKVPVPETVERFAEEFRNAEEALHAIESQIEQGEREADTCERSLDVLQADHDVPTEDRLKELRNRRDQAWRLIRRMWKGETEDSAEGSSFLASIDAAGQPLEDAFKDLVGIADTVSDRLRHEADRVARHGQLQVDLGRIRDRLSDLVQERESRNERCRTLDAQWRGLWRELGIEALTPSEMRTWLQRQGELIGHARTIRGLRGQESELAATLENTKHQLVAELQATGHDVDPSGKSLEEILDAAQLVLKSIDGLAAEHGHIERDVKRLQKGEQLVQDEHAEAEERLTEWREQWQAAIAHLPKVIADEPAEANQVLELLHQLSLKLNNAEQQRGRLAEIDAFCQQFVLQVSEVAQQVVRELVDSHTPEQLATAILARSRKAVEQDKERQRLLGELAKRRSDLEEATATVTELQSQLDQLCQQAGCRSSDDLSAAWECSERKREVLKRLEQLRKELRELSAATPLEEFIAEARSLDADALPVQIEQAEQEIANLERLLVDEIGPTIGREEGALRQLDSSGLAAEAEEQARDMLAALGRDAHRYAVLRVAQVALRRGIERYRERHQGPMLRTANDVFSRLTGGSFGGLKADYDPSGNAAVMGIRSGTGEAIPVSGMSDGTADQLYFALRYSWITNYLDNHESLPFIVDDILIRFDDDRACETLKELACLSNRTQVLFFTHHRHLLDVAQGVLSSDVLFIHDLSKS